MSDLLERAARAAHEATAPGNETVPWEVFPAGYREQRTRQAAAVLAVVADGEWIAQVLADHQMSGIINSQTRVAYCICDAEIPVPSGFDADGNALISELERAVQLHQGNAVAAYLRDQL